MVGIVSKDNFFEIKISRLTPLDSHSALSYYDLLAIFTCSQFKVINSTTIHLGLPSLYCKIQAVTPGN